VPDGAGSAWLWTPLWVLTASACWAVLGGVAGLALGLSRLRLGVRPKPQAAVETAPPSRRNLFRP